MTVSDDVGLAAIVGIGVRTTETGDVLAGITVSLDVQLVKAKNITRVGERR